MIFTLKITEGLFSFLHSGDKAFEIRRVTDGDIKVGDVIKFVGLNGDDFDHEKYPNQLFKVMFVLKGSDTKIGIGPDWRIYSLKQIMPNNPHRVDNPSITRGTSHVATSGNTNLEKEIERLKKMLKHYEALLRGYIDND